MTTEDKTIIGFAIVIGLGIFAMTRREKKASFESEKDEIIKQDCYNSGKEVNIPDEKIGEFVADCLAAIKNEEA